MHFPSINVLKIDVHYQLEKHVLTKNDDEYNLLCWWNIIKEKMSLK
jgi:hypothetical protein